MIPGNPVPYRIKRDGGITCLRAQLNNDYVHDKDTFGCRASENLTQDAGTIGEWRKESWFYTNDRRLQNSYSLQYLISGVDRYTWQLRLHPIGDTWTWDNTNKMLKNDRNGWCLNMKDSKNNDVDVQLYPCSVTDGNEKIELTLKTDPINYGNAQCKRADQHSWAGNFVMDKTPTRDEKAWCCVAPNLTKTSAQCGYNYCLDSAECGKFYDNDWCLDHPTSAECKNRPSVTDRRKADWCAADPNRLVQDPECKAVCNKRTDDVHVQCEDAAVKLCNSNPSIPECACLNQRKAGANDPDYKSFTAGMTPNRIPSLGDAECWLPKCAGHTETFSQLFRHLTSDRGLNCPSCIQNMVINSVNVEGGGVKIDQTCNQDAPKPPSPSPPPPSPAPSPTPTPSAIPSPSATAPIAAAPVPSSSKEDYVNKAKMYVNDPKNKNIMIGVGVAIVLLILFFVFSSKRSSYPDYY